MVSTPRAVTSARGEIERCGTRNGSTSCETTWCSPCASSRVTKDFFSTLKIRLIAGRTFDSRDRDDAPLVAIVDRATAKRYFQGANPVGQRIVLDDPAYPDKPREIVGVVGDVHGSSLAEEPSPKIYTPLSQSSGNYLTAVIRTNGSPRVIIGAARAQVAAIDPTLPTFGEKTMSERVEDTVAGPRFYMVLLASFAAVALILASVGIYGVMSYAVSQLTRDIGIRVALGASQGEILRLIVKQGMLLTGIGIVVGLAGAAAMGRVIGGLLFGTESTDLLTFGAVTLALSLVSLAACLIPARRAAGIDPLVAFRG
ncbi:MAG: ABC transporter permease [Gemmatimonadota bacterium]|nr:ABC transporter permease [Gemmatimonadota bacterium]